MINKKSEVGQWKNFKCQVSGKFFFPFYFVPIASKSI